MTKQPSSGTALLAPHGDGSRKGGLNKACLTPICLASYGQQASLPSGKKNNDRKKKTANLKVACSNIRTMQDSEDGPQQCSFLVAGKLALLDISVAALREVHFTEQGSLMEDGAGYTLFWSGKNKDEHHLTAGFMINFHCQKTAECASWSF